MLRVVNPGTGQIDVIHLPAAGWKRSGRGYRYRGDHPCRQVRLSRGLLRGQCKGEAVSFSLSEAQQGSIATRFDAGSKTALCTIFGGTVIQDFGIGFGAKPTRGSFLATDAAAPDTCPIP
jgi:hypothetical protein